MELALRQTAEYGYAPDYSVPVEFNELPQAQKDRLRRLAAHKANTDGFVRWVRQNIPLNKLETVYNPAKLQRLASCGSYLQFRQYHTLVPPKTVLSGSNSCKQHLLCPLCAIKREMKAVRTYWEKYQALIAKNPDLRLYYAVFTLKNEADFSETFNTIENGIRGLIKNRRDGRSAVGGNKRCKYVSALSAAFMNVAAGAYSFEIKRGSRQGLWHPHANMLLLTNGLLDYKAVRKEYKNLTNQKGQNLEFRPIAPDDKEAFMEIFKYALKFSDMAVGDRFHTAMALYRRNLFGSFGDFRGLKIDTTDSLEYADLPYLDLLYRYNAPLRIYVLDRIESKIPFVQRAEAFTPEGTKNIIDLTAKALQEGGLYDEQG